MDTSDVVSEDGEEEDFEDEEVIYLPSWIRTVQCMENSSVMIIQEDQDGTEDEDGNDLIPDILELSGDTLLETFTTNTNISHLHQTDTKPVINNDRFKRSHIKSSLINVSKHRFQKEYNQRSRHTHLSVR